MSDQKPKTLRDLGVDTESLADTLSGGMTAGIGAAIRLAEILLHRGLITQQDYERVQEPVLKYLAECRAKRSVHGLPFPDG